jgi:hypothetical protein
VLETSAHLAAPIAPGRQAPWGFPEQSPSTQPADPARDIAVSFLRLANLDNEMVDRLSRYESGLWRQLVQTIFALQTLKRR